MAYRELGEIPPNVVSEIAKFCRVLDLTSNLISYESQIEVERKGISQ